MVSVKSLMTGSFSSFVIPLTNKIYQNEFLIESLRSQLSCTSIIFCYVTEDVSKLPKDRERYLVGTNYLPRFVIPFDIFEGISRNVEIFSTFDDAYKLITDFELSIPILEKFSSIPSTSYGIGIIPSNLDLESLEVLS